MSIQKKEKKLKQKRIPNGQKDGMSYTLLRLISYSYRCGQKVFMGIFTYPFERHYSFGTVENK